MIDSKKLIISTVILAMVVTALGLAAVVFALTLPTPEPGDLVKLQGSSSVYYIGENNKRYTFPDEVTYKTWYDDFSKVQIVRKSILDLYENHGNVRARPGSILIQEVTNDTPWQIVSNKVYALDRGGVKHWLKTPEVAEKFFGSDWAALINPVPSVVFSVMYSRAGEDLASGSDYDRDAIMSLTPDIQTEMVLNEILEDGRY